MISRLTKAIVTVCMLVPVPPLEAVLLTAEPATKTYELKDVLALALERHPALAEAGAVLAQRRGQRLQAGAYPNPTVLGQTGEGKIRDPNTGLSRQEILLTLSQPLEWFGKRAARQREAEARVEGAREGVHEARLAVVAETKTAFYGLLLAQRERALAAENVVIVEDVARVARVRVETGEAPPLEALKATVELLKAKQHQARARKAVRTGQVGLNTVTGGALGRSFDIDGGFRGREPGLDLDVLIGRALAIHPTIQRLEWQVTRADEAVAAERQSRIPDLTFFGGYAREIGREAVLGGISLPTPIWSQRQGEIATAVGVKRQEEAALYRARNELATVVAQYVQDAEAAGELIAVYEEGLLKQAREAMRIARISFKQGAASLLDVLDAQRVFQRVQSEYGRALFEQSLALTRLERAVGGTL